MYHCRNLEVVHYDQTDEAGLVNLLPTGMQQGPLQVERTLSLLHSTHRPNLLVFGLGHDTPFWAEAARKRGGMAVFLENNEKWVNLAPKDIHSYKISYWTNMEEPIPAPDCSLVPDGVPTWVASTEWDVAIVDAPNGFARYWPLWWAKPNPGRAQSLYLATLLVQAGGYIVLDDAERDLEHALSLAYLPPERFEYLGCLPRLLRCCNFGNWQCHYRVKELPHDYVLPNCFEKVPEEGQS